MTRLRICAGYLRNSTTRCCRPTPPARAPSGLPADNGSQRSIAEGKGHSSSRRERRQASSTSTRSAAPSKGAAPVASHDVARFQAHPHEFMLVWRFADLGHDAASELVPVVVGHRIRRLSKGHARRHGAGDEFRRSRLGEQTFGDCPCRRCQPRQRLRAHESSAEPLKQTGPLIGGPAFVDRSTTTWDTAIQ